MPNREGKQQTKSNKQKKRKRGDEATSWDRLVPTASGNQVILYVRVDKELARRMKPCGDWLKERERKKEGTGIKENFPGKFCIFCLKAAVQGLEHAMEIEKRET